MLRLLVRGRSPLSCPISTTNGIRRVHEPTYQAPSPQQSVQPSNPHRAFWGTFGRPMAKVFTGAMVTYQICYWSWLKLETMELERTNDAEIHRLEARLRQLQDRLGKLDSTAK